MDRGYKICLYAAPGQSTPACSMKNIPQASSIVTTCAPLPPTNQILVTSPVNMLFPLRNGHLKFSTEEGGRFCTTIAFNF